MEVELDEEGGLSRRRREKPTRRASPCPNRSYLECVGRGTGRDLWTRAMPRSCARPWSSPAREAEALEHAAKLEVDRTRQSGVSLLSRVQIVKAIGRLRHSAPARSSAGEADLHAEWRSTVDVYRYELEGMEAADDLMQARMDLLEEGLRLAEPSKSSAVRVLKVGARRWPPALRAAPCSTRALATSSTSRRSGSSPRDRPSSTPGETQAAKQAVAAAEASAAAALKSAAEASQEIRLDTLVTQPQTKQSAPRKRRQRHRPPLPLIHLA